MKFAKKAKKALVGEEIETEEWMPDPVEKRKKKAADLHRRETIASATPAKYKTDKTEDPDKLYKRRMAVDSKTKMRKEEKDTPDQVKAVIANDRARKGTRDATYDSMHGKKKQAKKERDYAKGQRDKGAEDETPTSSLTP